MARSRGRVTSGSDVLVAGAGPTGLALALQAHDHGARVRVVERRADVLRPSRALVVHPRTLEVLRPLGVTDALLAKGDTSPMAHLHLGAHVVRVRLDEVALRDTAFPHLTLLRQADVEAALSQALAARGVPVERGTELVGLRDWAGGTDSSLVSLRSPAGVEETVCGFVAGCDGAASRVRALSGVGWRGGPYSQEVVLADVELDGDLDLGVAHVVAARGGLLFVFPVGERATWRLLATRPVAGGPSEVGQPRPAVPGEELQGLLDDAGLEARIFDVGWSARVQVQHRLAAQYRSGRLFLAGDAAHTHSPAAAQGMNTGIQDATNLGWKLAFAGSPLDPAGLLDSYEEERRPVARRVLALTHLVFWAEASTDPLASFLRGVLVPLGAPLLPFLLGRRRLLAEGVRVLSQLRLGYRGSRLSVEGTPRLGSRPRAGDRLPDALVTCEGRRLRLHELLARPGVHVLLQRDAREPGAGAAVRRLLVHRLTSAPGSGLVAVRPDGYVGFRCGTVDDVQLGSWLAQIAAVG